MTTPSHERPTAEPSADRSTEPPLVADTERAVLIDEQLVEARRRGRRPFGGEARKRVASLELAKRLLGDRLSQVAVVDELPTETSVGGGTAGTER